MKISQDTIDEIKNRIDIVDVVGEFLPLKKVGMNFRAKSPFSNERTPSFFVFPKNENFKDFSSGKGGDAITFLMEYDGLGYIEALLFLAKKYGVEVKEEEQSPEKKEEQSERESLMIVTNFAKNHYVQNLWETEEGKKIGLSYFKERGFSEETIHKFELGYSLNIWDDLEKTALKNGYQKEFLEKSGLVVSKTSDAGETKTYDRFRGRVIFPIHNNTGRPIAFGARILTSDKNQPKYLNSPESDIYHKSNILYGIFQARRAIRNENNCYLVEGYTDVISMHQAGVENVVSSSGTSLTEEQIKLIGRLTENVTVLFDGDEAGIRASVRGIDMILEQGLNVKALVFPDGDDPDSYAKKVGAFNFREYIKDNSRDFISFKTELFVKGAQKDPIKKAETINAIVSSISKIPDPVKRAVYLKETSLQLNIDESVLIAELNKIILQKRRDKQKSESREAEPIIEIQEERESKNLHKNKDLLALENQEREALNILINFGEIKTDDDTNLVKFYLDELNGIQFSNKTYSDILKHIEFSFSKGIAISHEIFRRDDDVNVYKTVHDIISESERYEVSLNWEKRIRKKIPGKFDVLKTAVEKNIKLIKFYNVKILENEIKKQISEFEKYTDVEGNKINSEREIENLQKIHLELLKEKVNYAKPDGIVTY